MGGKSFPKRKCVRKRKILLNKSLPIFWKETKKKTPIPIISCYLLFGVFFCVATFCWLPPPLKQWPVLIPITFAHQAELATSHEVRWLKGSRKVGGEVRVKGKKVDPWKNMGVSENSGTPKSSILIGFSIIFTIQFWGTPIFGNTHMKKVLGWKTTFGLPFVFFFGGAGGKFYSSVYRVLGDFLVDHLHGRLVSQ